MAIPGVIDDNASEEAGRNEPRRFVRLLTEGIRTGGETASLRLHNISVGGLMIESPVDFEVGEELAIDLPDVGPTDAKIVWRSETLYGARFVEPLPQKALSAAKLKSAIAQPDAAILPPGIDRASLGKRLATMRQERGLTLAQVAEELGVSKPTVWAWEHDRSQPVASRISAIAEVLGVSEIELATGRDTSQAEHAIAETREMIAKAYGCTPQQVRISIDL
ncbi:helix-turn-helix domain-containing protein [Erythrobacter litoralis]|uniref:DNA-binding protein, putative n=1 Tax=Erythrobacter litoralis (strain HTCC2594) TaxID=314225 RepID=Q2N7L0_ERYLH|nr:helix-turn-helix domain-containing protein [Erythrobacter litoralis]ABC64331.1 DNA-binding protein, putative [Erythrobacter litoralis HTCC2594]